MRNKSLVATFVLILCVPKVVSDGIKVHVNWCGPGHGGSVENDLPFTDNLDCICRTHDLCYSKYGTLNCECDNLFVRETKQIKNPKLELVAKPMAGYFSSSPCVGPVEVPGFCTKCTKLPILGKKCGPVPCIKCAKKAPAITSLKVNINRFECPSK